MTKELEKYENLKDSVLIIGNDVKWLKKFFWIVAIASVGGWVTSFFSLTNKVLAK